MKISFLASHSGSAARYIIAAMRAGQLDAQPGLLITNNQNSDIYRWCQKHAIDVVCISTKTHPLDEARDKAIHTELKAVDTDFVVLSGYMKKIGPLTLSGYANKIFNVHPSLLPRHGGQGLYGDKVHESVLKSGDKQSGATVQFVSEEYDQGPIITQQAVAVSEGETLATLKAKVQAIENELYLTSLKQLLLSSKG
ncbi:MAG: phosphoribosylglycinamide formyltransferase [Porticoccaceae bacterium]